MRLTNGLFILFFILPFASCNEESGSATRNPARDSLLASQPDKAMNTYSNIDISPMDMSYFPVDYPKLKMADHQIAPPVARVVYSRPHLGNRRLFPDILKHGEAWRLGANEATELDLYRDLYIMDSKVKAGRYNLYCIPQPGNWIIVLNSNVDTWGLKQDSSLDLHRFTIPITTGHPPLEFFTMEFEPAPKGAMLNIAWDDVVGKLPLVF